MTIEERAKQYAKTVSQESGLVVYDAYIAGATAQREIDIERAVELYAESLNSINNFENTKICIEGAVRLFKQAMKGEEIMTIEETTKVIQAHEMGLVIEQSLIGKDEWQEVGAKWVPRWDMYEYRVKSGQTMPEPKKPEYVPYANAKEFRSAQRKHGLYLMYREGSQDKDLLDTYLFPITFHDDGLTITDGDKDDPFMDFHYDEALEHLKWEDGTPCGKLKV